METIVLAGGAGTRLWPLARESRPKPLLPVAGGVSPLRRALQVAARVSGRGHTWLVASREMARHIRAHIGRERMPRLVLEPSPRNTAPALALAAGRVQRRLGPSWTLCIPADQWIRRGATFAATVRRITALDPAPWLITFGVPARSAHPGYGYIRAGGRLRGPLRAVLRFVEKPSPSRARRYARSGRWLWNCGIFLWRTDTFLAEVRRALPETARAALGLVSADARARRAARLRWGRLRPISVDHSVLETAPRVAVAPCRVGWQDLGSWGALAENLSLHPDGTRHCGLYRSIGGSGCIVHASGRLTVNVGARCIGLVVTDDAILLFDRDQDQRVREVADLLARDASLARYR